MKTRRKPTCFLGVALALVFILTGCNDLETNHREPCAPDSARCSGNLVERCLVSGNTWQVVKDCGDSASCVEGICLDDSCTPGTRLCAADNLYECAQSGTFWTRTVCAEGTWCLFGECVECVSDEGCPDSEVCDQSACVPSAVRITSLTLPEGVVGVPYEAELTAERGGAPYAWSLDAGALPPGLALAPETGRITGNPLQEGDYPFTVTVTDAVDARDTRELTIRIRGTGLDLVTSPNLPQAEEGMPYEVQLRAAGGLLPYGWMLHDGVLPAGLDLFADGRIAGTPAEIGVFPFEARVFDSLEPPQYATKAFSLTVRMAPLQILGEAEYNFYVTKIIVLEMIFPYFPYNEQLLAKGGLRPYLWEDRPVPASLAMMLQVSGVDSSSWGVPAGLTLEPDGRLHGSRTDVSDAQTLTIPVSNITVTGYFFYARVSDSQFPPAFQEAVYVIPTLPLSEP